MTLRLLLEAHLSRAVAEHLTMHESAIDVIHASSWQDGAYRTVSDTLLLEAAARTNLTLVSYDQATLPDLLSEWYLLGKEHAGVILIDQRAIPQGDTGAQVRALLHLWQTQRHREWRNLCIYLGHAPLRE